MLCFVDYLFLALRPKLNIKNKKDTSDMVCASIEALDVNIFIFYELFFGHHLDVLLPK